MPHLALSAEILQSMSHCGAIWGMENVSQQEPAEPVERCMRSRMKDVPWRKRKKIFPLRYARVAMLLRTQRLTWRCGVNCLHASAFMSRIAESVIIRFSPKRLRVLKVF